MVSVIIKVFYRNKKSSFRWAVGLRETISQLILLNWFMAPMQNNT